MCARRIMWTGRHWREGEGSHTVYRIPTVFSRWFFGRCSPLDCTVWLCNRSYLFAGSYLVCQPVSWSMISDLWSLLFPVLPLSCHSLWMASIHARCSTSRRYTVSEGYCNLYLLIQVQSNGSIRVGLSTNWTMRWNEGDSSVYWLLFSFDVYVVFPGTIQTTR